MKNLVVLSGAGISAESGLQTFRDSNGLWNNHSVDEVCTTDAWDSNPIKVNNFYNDVRKSVLAAEPNQAHIALAEAEKLFNVKIITTNVDDLHERAGSTKVLHLHGQILKGRSDRHSLSTLEDYLLEPHLVDIGLEGIQENQEALDGFTLRPHVVFYGEQVPNLSLANEIVRDADYFIIVGTTLSVYPAAGLSNFAEKAEVSYYIDPSLKPMDKYTNPFHTCIAKKATVGIPEVLELLSKRS